VRRGAGAAFPARPLAAGFFAVAAGAFAAAAGGFAAVGLPAAAVGFLAAGVGFCADALGVVSLFPASFLADGFLASDCFLASASFAGFGAAARWPLSAIKDANARASGRVGKFLDAGITILFPSGPRTWAGTGLDAAWRKKLVGGFPPSPFTNR
jgi:hypothetical protein